jgi:hypothetical protein
MFSSFSSCNQVLQELTMPVKVTARARFSRYAVVPRGVNFGPMVYDTMKERTFELSNTGEFDFTYTIRRAGAANAGWKWRQTAPLL